MCFLPSSICAHSALTPVRLCQGQLWAVTNWFSPSSSRGSQCWDCEADACPGARRRWHELDDRGADVACHHSQLTSLISPASKDKARGPQRSLRGTGECSIAGMGEGAVLDRDDPIGQGRLVGEGVVLMLPAGWMPWGTHIPEGVWVPGGPESLPRAAC